MRLERENHNHTTNEFEPKKKIAIKTRTNTSTQWNNQKTYSSSCPSGSSPTACSICYVYLKTTPITRSFRIKRNRHCFGHSQSGRWRITLTNCGVCNSTTSGIQILTHSKIIIVSSIFPNGISLCKRWKIIKISLWWSPITRILPLSL